MSRIPTTNEPMSPEEARAWIGGLYLKNEAAMFWTAMRIVHDEHMARDMVSSACEAMLRNTDKLLKVEACKLTGYVLRIVENETRMYLRKKKRERLCLVGDDGVFDRATHEHHEVDEELISEAENKAVREALKRIHTKEREVLLMKYFENLSNEEIAEQLEIKKDSVRFYLTKARRSLAAVLMENEWNS